MVQLLPTNTFLKITESSTVPFIMVPLAIREFLTEEDGIGTVEMILILVVLIGLVLIFKEQLTTLVNNIFKTITTKSNEVGK